MQKNADKKEYTPVKEEDMECKDFLNDVIGYTGDEFCDRPVVLFRQTPGSFASTSVKNPKVRAYTLHNGILNQCSVHPDGRPGAYWAVLDAMSDLKENFSKDEVVTKAVSTLVKYDGRFNKNAAGARKACTAAFYILKTHLTHPSRKNMGFGFIVEKTAPKRFKIRGRLHKEFVDEVKPQEQMPV